MSRRIIATQLQSRGAGQEVDTYSDKLLKNIPAEIIAAWVTASNLINSASDTPKNTVLWIAFLIGVVLTVFWTKKQTDVKGLPTAWTQISIATGSFVVWVFALGGPFASLSFYRPLYGALLLILYTLVVPLITPKESTVSASRGRSR